MLTGWCLWRSDMRSDLSSFSLCLFVSRLLFLSPKTSTHLSQFLLNIVAVSLNKSPPLLFSLAAMATAWLYPLSSSLLLLELFSCWLMCPDPACLWFVNSLVFVWLTGRATGIWLTHSWLPSLPLSQVSPSPTSSSGRLWAPSCSSSSYWLLQPGVTSECLHPPHEHWLLSEDINILRRNGESRTFGLLLLMDWLSSLHRSYKQRRYVESEVHRRFCRFARFHSLTMIFNQIDGV